MIENKIIEMANNTKFNGLKKDSTHSSSLKNKKCGDRIKVEIKIKNKRIKEMRYETESCVFCEASASILSVNVKNKKISEIDKIKNTYQFKYLLSKKFISRKDCVMLPLEAIKKAIKI